MKASFEEVYRQYYSRLYTLAFRMTGNTPDAEDVLQTSFLHAYSAFSSFRGDSEISTWLYRIVINASKKFRKEAFRLPVDSYAEENNVSLENVFRHINSFGSVEDAALVKQTRESCLQMFINCMPQKYRAVYTLRVILDLPVRATTEILEMSESSVKVCLYRARKIAAGHINGRCSLIRPGAMCDCRLFAGYLRETGKAGKLLDIRVIERSEEKAKEEYEKEISDLAKIDRLYRTGVEGRDYGDFIESVRKLKESKRYRLLET